MIQQINLIMMKLFNIQKNISFGCMMYFTSDDWVYLNDNDDIPKIFHENFKNKQDPEITITFPMRLLDKQLKPLPKHLVDKMLVTWVQKNIQVVAKLLITDVSIQRSQKKDRTYIQEKMLKILWAMLIFQYFAISF